MPVASVGTSWSASRGITCRRWKPRLVPYVNTIQTALKLIATELMQ
ncbi:hypothetical protein SAMN02745746_01273 [Pseudogulbenkiania subflava DSM 22618]|uniref:Uncharacterized protein n=1 Tax=Pseudogulbenkiania subflava DSM 22618 TaxID=1123014 RepID=A0A1Y6BGT3_9NEIS|nr:hypothetical protein SAMN02745746_01273 [Pseudogulbenkiania subflava DSM 22618]